MGLIVVLAVAAITGEFTNFDSQKSATSEVAQLDHPHQNDDQGQHARAHTSQINYTRHAECRMQCRKISEQEVFEVLKSGQKNIKKSNPQASPCPVTALEGLTSDNQFVRVVYGQCGRYLKIITVIDLNNDVPCDCD